jgi:hypothetical protein
MPTLSAAPLGNPQVILAGTPPNESIPADVFRRMRSDARSGRDGSLSWHEWSAEGVGDVGDRRRWYRINPALGKRISEDFVESELASMSDDGFARERLCYWAEASAETLIGGAEWDALRTDSPPEKGKTAYGVKFSPDGSAVALAAALKRGRKTHIEVVAHKSMSGGTSWLAEWICERWRGASAVVIDGLNGASALSETLVSGGVPKRVVVLPGARDVVAASAMLLNAVREKTVTHYGQPALDECAKGAVRRSIGKNGGWGFGGSADPDVSPLEAAALAHYGAVTSKRDPERKQRLV